MSALLPYLAAVLCLGVPSLLVGLTLWDEHQFRKFQKKCGSVQTTRQIEIHFNHTTK